MREGGGVSLEEQSERPCVLASHGLPAVAGATFSCSGGLPVAAGLPCCRAQALRHRVFSSVVRGQNGWGLVSSAVAVPWLQSTAQ